MARKKDNDLEDEGSSWIFDDDASDSDLTAPTDGGFTSRIDHGFAGAGNDIGDRPTEIIPNDLVDEETIIEAFGTLGGDEDEVSEDPVVGWLVVVKGKGIGHSAELGAGINRIGRSGDERVALPFGDKAISSMDHVRIIYDDEARSFLIAPGSSNTASRLKTDADAKPKMVLEARDLPNYAIIHLSKTTAVRFVAFCDETFDWSDLAEDGGTA